MKKIVALVLFVSSFAFSQMTQIGYVIPYSSTMGGIGFSATAGSRYFGPLNAANITANDSTSLTGTIMTRAGTFQNLWARKTSASGGVAIVALRVNGRANPGYIVTDSIVDPLVLYKSTRFVNVSVGDTVHVFVAGSLANQGGIQWSVDFVTAP